MSVLPIMFVKWCSQMVIHSDKVVFCSANLHELSDFIHKNHLDDGKLADDFVLLVEQTLGKPVAIGTTTWKSISGFWKLKLKVKQKHYTMAIYGRFARDKHKLICEMLIRNKSRAKTCVDVITTGRLCDKMINFYGNGVDFTIDANTNLRPF